MTNIDEKTGGFNNLEIKDNKTNIYDYIFSLEEEIRILNNEKRALEGKQADYQHELLRLKKELELYKNPPLIVGIVQEIMPENNTAIIKNSNGPEFLVEFDPELRSQIKVGNRVGLCQKNLALTTILPNTKDARAKAMEVIDRPDVTFESIGGLENTIQELHETVSLPLTNPEKFDSLGISPPNGILLHGKPGTGKTMLAKALANHSNTTFIRLVGSELAQKFIGEGASLVRDVFAHAAENSPAIIFIDEIDAIGAQRLDIGTGGDREISRTLMQLLAEIDGFQEKSDIKLMAATNRIDILDPALLRPGRFDKIIEVTEPDETGREKIIDIYTKKMAVHDEVNSKHLAQKTEGATGAEIKAICTEAGIFALREDKDKVELNHFDQAIKKVKNTDSIITSPNQTRMFS